MPDARGFDLIFCIVPNNCANISSGSYSRGCQEGRRCRADCRLGLRCVDANASNGLATPLYYAIDGGHSDAARLLLGRGADVEAQNIWAPALVPAASGGKVELVRLLLDSGANPNAHFKTKTSLHIAAEHGWLDFVIKALGPSELHPCSGSLRIKMMDLCS